MKNTASFSKFMTILLSYFVVFTHISGGLFLALGLFTRAGCLIQIPVLMEAIIFVNINATKDAFSPYSDLFLSAIILLLLIYFLIICNGPFSVKVPPEEHLKEHEDYIKQVKREKPV